LKIETQYLEDHQAKLTVEVEPDLLEGAKRRAARRIANRVKIPGFRPGKAPYQVIVRQIGDAAILEEALEILVDDIYPKAIEEANIHPYGPGKLEKVNSMTPPILDFVVPLKAEVTPGDYHSIRKSHEPPQVTDEEVIRVLENLRERQALIEPVERPAQEGDLVTILLSAKRQPVDGGNETDLIRERSVPVIIRPHSEGKTSDSSDDVPEWPFVGFSHYLIGLSANDKKTIPYKYPEESQDYQALRGVEAKFHFIVENVKSRTLPELNNEFATTVGEYSDLDSLRNDVRSTLEKQALQDYNETYDEAVLDEAIKLAEFKYPPQMLEREIDDVISNLEDRLKQQNQTIDLYLKSRNLDKDSLRKEATPVAETRLKKSLLLSEIVRAESIEIQENELQTETMNTMNMLARTLPEKDARKLSDENVVRNLAGNVMADMLLQRSREKLRDIASGKLSESKEDAINSQTDEVSDHEHD
jgi:trigger factor